MTRQKQPHFCSICGKGIDQNACTVMYVKKRRPLKYSDGFVTENSLPQVKLCDTCAVNERARLISVRIDHGKTP